MSTRRPRSHAMRPSPEQLENRQLLARSVSGIDIDGDHWILRLLGPGDLRVINQNGSDGQPAPFTSPASIKEIDIGGADPQTTRLVGQVTKGPNGDGKVFFENLKELGGASQQISANVGINAIDIPDFWLGHTDTAAPASGTPAGSISIPDGIVTLRFGGVDSTYTPPGGTSLATNNTSDRFTVSLGLPAMQGTSIIINKSISNAQAASTSTGTATQDSVSFSVAGRINLFQANEIDGNAALPPASFPGTGGTEVISLPSTAAAVAGAIGYIRVGGNATNFGVQTSGRVSNFFVGGETANVGLLAPDSVRNVYFGKGMDTTTILANEIFTLYANRGALNSSVTSTREIGQIMIGGDVVNTTILSGYQQDLATIFQTQTAPTTTPPAQNGGSMPAVLIAGDVVDSVFASSTDPFQGVFGDPLSLRLPTGNIKAKVEGTIDNQLANPTVPTQAFFAQHASVITGPVTPPNVPEAPYPNAGGRPRGPHVVNGLQPASPNRRVTIKPPKVPASQVSTTP